MLVTIWLNESGEWFDSQYGRVSPIKWCEEEICRIAKKGGEAHLVRNKKNNCEIAIDVTKEPE